MGGTQNTRIQGKQGGYNHRWGELRIPGYKVSRRDFIIDGGNSEYQDTRYAGRGYHHRRGDSEYQDTR